MKAVVNRIIPFSSVDGPGNRTAVFLQGCNINCKYCHNPETRKLCVQCGTCVKQCPAGALSFDENGNPVSSDYLYMNGAEIFTFTQKNVPVVVKDTLLKNNLEQPEINLFVLHQANKYMLNFLRKKMKIEEEKFYYFLSEVGNTVSSSIPLALCEAKRENRLNGNVLLAGFGVGYSWAGVVLKA